MGDRQHPPCRRKKVFIKNGACWWDAQREMRSYFCCIFFYSSEALACSVHKWLNKTAQQQSVIFSNFKSAKIKVLGTLKVENWCWRCFHCCSERLEHPGKAINWWLIQERKGCCIQLRRCIGIGFASYKNLNLNLNWQSYSKEQLEMFFSCV